MTTPNFTTTTKALQRISEIFGQPVIPLCIPDKNGGCRVIGAGHGPDCPHPGKRPLIKGWQEPGWKLSPEDLERYARVGANWGLRLGGCLVELDFDDPAKYQDFTVSHTLPEDTPVILSGRKGGGYKIILRAKKPPPKNFIHDGFEVRVSGLLVIPPSLHKSGNNYRWLRLNGCAPEVDMEKLLGVKFEEQKQKPQGSHPPLTTEQQKAAEKALFDYLPGARYINGELNGYLDPDSQSKAHVKVNLARGCFYDFRKGQGGTIKELLRRMGAPIPPEMGGMGDGDIPEFFPIWAISRDWKEAWKCGEPIPVARSDGTPIWVGRAFCMQWQCAECAIRLKNILKAKLKSLQNQIIKAGLNPELQVWQAPRDGEETVAGKIARLKRGNKNFHYARAINRDEEYVLAWKEDWMDADLTAAGFKFTELKPEDVIDGLPYAAVRRRQRRFIASKNFWDVGVNILTLQAESNIINSNNDEQNEAGKGEEAERKKEAKERKKMGKLDREVKRLLRRGRTLGQIAESLGEDMETVKAAFDRIAGEKPYDIVVLDGGYEQVLERLRAKGFQLVDTSGGCGDSYQLLHPAKDPPEMAPEELGKVVDVIEF